MLGLASSRIASELPHIGGSGGIPTNHGSEGFRVPEEETSDLGAHRTLDKGRLRCLRVPTFAYEYVDVRTGSGNTSPTHSLRTGDKIYLATAEGDYVLDLPRQRRASHETLAAAVGN